MSNKSARRLPSLTIGIFALFLIFFILDYMLLAPENVRIFSASHLVFGETGGGTLTRLLHMSRQEVMDGEVWRLISHIFLHGGLISLFLSSLGFCTLGSIIEPYIGKFKFLFAFLFTAAFSAGLMMWLSPDFAALGASAANHGLLGVLTALLLKYGRSFSSRITKLHWPLLAFILITNIWWEPSLVIAHMAAFTGGVLLSLLLFYRKTA